MKEINLKIDGSDVLTEKAIFNQEEPTEFDYVVSTIPVSKYENLKIEGMTNDQSVLLRTFTANNLLGRNRKVFLLFSTPWWSTITSGHFDYCVEKTTSCIWTTPVHQNSANINATVHSLTLFTGGKATENIDKTVKKVLKQLFKKFGDKIGDSYIKSVKGYDWQTDKNIGGSYSGMRTPGSEANYKEMIASKNFGRLYFAGEAFSEANYGYIDGAIETGKNAASWIESFAIYTPWLGGILIF